MKLFALGIGHTGMRLVSVIALLSAPTFAQSVSVNGEHVRVTLMSEQDALVPGKPVWLGIRLEHEPHWHTYWVNPGDSGLPTKLDWQLPEGYLAGDIAWPAPERITVGDLYNFGYEGDALLPIAIEVPATAMPGSMAHLAVAAKWLVCREECIPGKANLAVDLPVRSAAADVSRRQFDAARAAQPQPAAWRADARIRDDQVEVTLHGADAPAALDAFIVQRKLVNYAPPQIVRNVDGITLSFAKSDYFSSAPSQIDLVLRSGERAWSVNAPLRP